MKKRSNIAALLTMVALGALVWGAPAAAAAPLVPVSLRSVSPVSGPVGTSVTITGTNLGVVNTVSFGGVAAAFTRNGTTQIVAVVPRGAATGPLVLAAPTTQARYLDFVVTTPPVLTSFSPRQGGGSTVVTIVGAHLRAVTGVSFGSIAATTWKAVSDTTITAAVPLGANTGTIHLTFGTAGASVTSVSKFAVQPSVTALRVFGREAIVRGYGLAQSSAWATFNGLSTRAPYLDSAGGLHVPIPVGQTQGDLAIPGFSWPSVSAPYLVPDVFGFSPGAGGPAGTLVTIAGQNFTDATSVTVGGVPATGVTVVSDYQITFRVPAGAVAGHVAVIAPGGTGTSTQVFTPAGP